MEKALEFFDAWAKNQKDFMENWTKSQKAFLENWAEATKKLQESFLNLGGPQEGPMKEMSNYFNSWVNTMVSSSKTFTDQAMNMQEAWKGTVEKQMEMSREMAKKFLELFKQAGEKK